MKYLLVIISILSLSHLNAQIVSERSSAGAFSIVAGQKPTAIYVDGGDYDVVQKAVLLLQNDIQMVTGQKPEIVSIFPSSGNVIVIGSADKSSAIRNFIASG